MKHPEDMTLKELKAERIGLQDDLGEIIYQLDHKLFNMVEHPESEQYLKKNFAEITGRIMMIDETIDAIKNEPDYSHMNIDSDNWSLAELRA